MLVRILPDRHPDWDETMIQKEAARRMANSLDSPEAFEIVIGRNDFNTGIFLQHKQILYLIVLRIAANERNGLHDRRRSSDLLDRFDDVV